ncbi:MAG: alpha/beta fold hydrolase [Planctomycetota bacterium]|nr:alpha/beta fold hydrolase [Planctomycetota bacterium]
MRTPSLLAHPDWERPAPVVFWMHGRTVNKELDPGRYLRWLRAGIATCAVDLPGHGERADPVMQTPRRTLDVLAQMRAEIDGIVAALNTAEYKGVFDTTRMAIGGMSAGGMIALRRLCDPHPFRCAAVECTTGWLGGLYFPQPESSPESAAGSPGAINPRWLVEHDPQVVRQLDAMEHLTTFRPIPLLALHSRGDQVVPFAIMEQFIARLREHYSKQHARPELVQLHAFDQTGAPQEHAGFGRFSNDAKNIQTSFLSRELGAVPHDLDAAG